MTRPPVTYLILFATFAAGLWVVLAFGSTLQAPPSIAGRYLVEWDAAPDGPADLPPEVIVGQSGLFVTLAGGDRPLGAGRMAPTVRPDDSVVYGFRPDRPTDPMRLGEVRPGVERLTLEFAGRRGVARRAPPPTEHPDADRPAPAAPASRPTSPTSRPASRPTTGPIHPPANSDAR